MPGPTSINSNILPQTKQLSPNDSGANTSLNNTNTTTSPDAGNNLQNGQILTGLGVCQQDPASVFQSQTLTSLQGGPSSASGRGDHMGSGHQ